MIQSEAVSITDVRDLPEETPAKPVGRRDQSSLRDTFQVCSVQLIGDNGGGAEHDRGAESPGICVVAPVGAVQGLNPTA